MSDAELARESDWKAAAKQVDWTQILLNLLNGQETGRDGQPCFFIGGGHFCGRAKFWDGHIVTTDGSIAHRFVPLAALLSRVRLEEAEHIQFEEEQKALRRVYAKFYKPIDQPQAASDGPACEVIEPFDVGGPLSKEDLLALNSLEKTHPNLWRHFRECGQAVLELQKREIERKATSGGALSVEEVKSCFPASSTTQDDAEWWKICTDRLNTLLAAHDQKVRREVLEAINDVVRESAVYRPEGRSWITGPEEVLAAIRVALASVEKEK